MFDLKEFYRQAESGEAVSPEGIVQYISSFETVILWGAGNLGTALGQLLGKHKVPIAEYWDIKAGEEFQACNGIAVKQPFHCQYDADHTLIISCIVNGSLGDQWPVHEIQRQGYRHYLYGMVLFEALGCPLHHGCFDIRVCTSTKACSLCNCARYANLIQGQMERDENSLTFQLLTFIISTRCSLKCRHCGQRLAEYRPEDRKDYAKQAIFRDIDHVMEAIDFVGMVSVIGGEPFLHPHLPEIIGHLLKWKNFGAVNITTNGIFTVSEDFIRALCHDRVKISFSAYSQFLTEQQKRILDHNISLAERSGISYSVAHPLWVTPQELRPYGYTQQHMREAKAHCSSRKMGVSVKDGKFIACTTVENLDGLRLYHNSGDIVDVTVREGLRERLAEHLDKPFYQACQYCGNEKMEEIPAGEQL